MSRFVLASRVLGTKSPVGHLHALLMTHKRLAGIELGSITDLTKVPDLPYPRSANLQN